jgi:hypothetical protein
LIITTEGKQLHIRHLARPCLFRLPFPLYCDVAEACKCFTSSIT